MPSRQAISQTKLLRQGKCRRCGAKRSKSKVYCKNCRAKVNAEARRRYWEVRELAGLTT